jgi:hypothetical protein
MQSGRLHDDFYSEDKGSKSLQNSGNNPSDYMVKHLRRQEYFSVFSTNVKEKLNRGKVYSRLAQ